MENYQITIRKLKDGEDRYSGEDVFGIRFESGPECPAVAQIIAVITQIVTEPMLSAMKINEAINGK